MRFFFAASRHEHVGGVDGKLKTYVWAYQFVSTLVSYSKNSRIIILGSFVDGGGKRTEKNYLLFNDPILTLLFFFCVFFIELRVTTFLALSQ